MTARMFRDVRVAMEHGSASAGSGVTGPERGHGVHVVDSALIGDPALVADPA